MLLVFLAGLILTCGGCGGINTGASVSPLDFLMPGLIKNDTNSTTNNVVSLSANTEGFALNK